MKRQLLLCTLLHQAWCITNNSVNAWQT